MYSKEQILEEIKRIALICGTKSLKQNQFRKHSRISTSAVRYHFGSWNTAVTQAGLSPIDPVEMIRNKETIPDNDLLKDLIRLYNEYGKEPTASLVNAKGKYSERPYRARWNTLAAAFQIAARDFQADLSPSPAAGVKSMSPIISETVRIIPATIRPKNEKKKRIVFGDPIDFRGLRFAPVNEQGVVYLFGMISQELGYHIESIRTEYPDCEGKRCFDKSNKQWEHIQIEFEYKSSNFKEHGHDPEGCDVIVCWEHDWSDCPIEVLELRNVIKLL